jgi:formyl-CoA transferase
MTESIFSSLKVIDCASWIAGPAAATIMSDCGADVIKGPETRGDAAPLLRHRAPRPRESWRRNLLEPAGEDW